MGRFIYGGDYNPEQWLDRPDILEKDIEMMKKAGINEATVGVFSWAMLEPEEGKFNFEWLEKIVDNLYANGISVIMATPSGARPRWLASKYPEVLRTASDGKKSIYGGRHNHCLTSEKYREKVSIIDRKLAEKFANHPAVLYWHISNELSGECYCEKCRSAFREYVKKKYGTVDRLNHEYWSTFWSHNYNSFDEVDPPMEIGDGGVSGLTLDWKRFVTQMTIDFVENEKKALREGGAKQGVTTNMMCDFDGLDYGMLEKPLDIISWDSYPEWGKTDGDNDEALITGMCHDSMRAYKNKPFLLMESCPSSTNWQSVSRLKRPGLLKCASLQAVGHGADSVQYFQIRQGRGSCEKFHGAVIDHSGRDDTRVYKECCEIGHILDQISEISGTVTNAKVAIIYDTQNRWALNETQGPRNIDIGYSELVRKFYKAFKNYGIDVDVIDQDHSYDGYRIMVAPMLYSIRNNNEERLERFVTHGGTLIASYLTGVVNENDLCHLGETPHNLCDVFGIVREEIDGLYDGQFNTLQSVDDRYWKGSREYRCDKLCELIGTRGSEILMKYGRDFYAGKAALTRNEYAEGEAYYLAANPEQKMLDEFISKVAESCGVERILKTPIEGVDIQSRQNEKYRYIFVENFSDDTVLIEVAGDSEVIYGDSEYMLEPYNTMIIRQVI